MKKSPKTIFTGITIATIMMAAIPGSHAFSGEMITPPATASSTLKDPTTRAVGHGRRYRKPNVANQGREETSACLGGRYCAAFLSGFQNLPQWQTS